MAYDLVRMQKSIKATVAITAQFVFVKLDSNGQVVLCGSNQYAIGVTQDKPGAGDPCSVCGPGDITKVLCGGTFLAGQDVCSDASGNAVAAVTAGAVLGMALTAGTAGSIATILYQPKGATGVI
jgi:hypothetical protein